MSRFICLTLFSAFTTGLKFKLPNPNCNHQPKVIDTDKKEIVPITEMITEPDANFIKHPIDPIVNDELPIEEPTNPDETLVVID